MITILITDRTNRKMYVGSAYGNDMFYAIWSSCVKTGHGGNLELKKVDSYHVEKNFRYSILDT